MPMNLKVKGEIGTIISFDNLMDENKKVLFELRCLY
jgi:hypothetical protein